MSTDQSSIPSTLLSTLLSPVMEPSKIEPQPRRRGLKARDNHTARVKNTRTTSPVRIDFKPEIEQIDKHTSVRYTTAFDDAGFEMYCDKSWRGEGILLGKNHLWDVAVASLEEHAVAKHTHRVRDQFKGTYVTDYQLPITGEQIIHTTHTKPKARHSSRYFYFMGKKMDTTMIYYTPKKNVYEPYGRFVYVEKDPLTVPITGKMKLVGNTDAITINQAEHAIGSCSKDTPFDFTYPVYQKDFKYIEVDFNKDVTITHISTMGRTIHLGRRTYYEDSSDQYFGKHHDIQYAKERSVHCVTSYRIEARTRLTKKWFVVGDFPGNTDRLTENYIRFEEPITAQFFRITPLSYNTSPSMNFRFYTMSDSSVEEEETKTKTLTYTLYHPSDQHYKTSSAKIRGCGCPGCQKLKESHNARRARIRSAFRPGNINEDALDHLKSRGKFR